MHQVGHLKMLSRRLIVKKTKEYSKSRSHFTVPKSTNLSSKCSRNHSTYNKNNSSFNIKHKSWIPDKRLDHHCNQLPSFGGNSNYDIHRFDYRWMMLMMTMGFGSIISCGDNSNAQQNLESEWEDFMIKSMNPEEDEEEEEEEEENDDGDEEQEEGEEEEESEVENEEIKDTRKTENDIQEKANPDVPKSDEIKNVNQIETSNNSDDSDLEKAGDESELESDENSNSEQGNSPSSEEDPYDNLPEEDEPTTCVICLINRQGPCRPLWRKFECCMKDNPSSDDDSDGDENSNSSSSSMAEKCDKYMFPWIGCIQSYRNTYTLISNDFFQKELIDEIEKNIGENEKVLLDDIDASSIVQMSKEWWGDGNSSNDDNSVGDENPEDPILVEGVARINLFDGDKPIEVAYIKDQDGKLLGYDQFSEFKKSIDAEGNSDDSNSAQKVAQCNFHVSPESTKAIQIFALYKGTDEKEDNKSETQKEPESRTNTTTTVQKQPPQTLYISSLVQLSELSNPSEIDSTINTSAKKNE